jgi:lipid kinase YegS
LADAVSGEKEQVIRIILNGKKAGLSEVRSAVELLRQESAEIEVRVTWEKGDAERFVSKAGRDGVRRIVAAGGDGTINEVVNGLAGLEKEKRPELAIMPLGTANDFASACNIPPVPLDALRLALQGKALAVDIVQANDRYFINVASGGFGSQITAETPPQLKNFLGGGAYALTAVLRSLNFTPSHGRLRARDTDMEGAAVLGVVCNGRQAGGGQLLAPDACIDDGLLDIVVILAFPFADIAQVLQEIKSRDSGKYVKRIRSSWAESWPQEIRSVNLDGEPYEANHIRFEVVPGAIQLVVPDHCPCIKEFDH